MNLIEQLEALIAKAKEDGTKFYDKKNDSAGTRLRQTMMDVKRLTSDIRNNVTEVRAERKASK